MIEAVGFLAREREHLLRARREIAHGFVAHTGNIMLRVRRFVQCDWENQSARWKMNFRSIKRNVPRKLAENRKLKFC
jgi:hypothetical protein